MKYNVGDKVKIREDLDTDKRYGTWDCSIAMANYGGSIATIVHCYDDSYHINVDGELYDWTDEMFENDEESESKDEKTVDVGYYLEYCGHRILKDVLQGETGVNRLYYTKNYNIQYIIPIDAIDFIVPHED